MNILIYVLVGVVALIALRLILKITFSFLKLTLLGIVIFAVYYVATNVPSVLLLIDETLK